MATKSLFHFYDDENAQRMYQAIVRDVIEVYGHDCWYVPRTVDTKAELFNEAEAVRYTTAYPIEVYVKPTDHMGGEGALLMKFGLQEYDELTFTVSMQAWSQLIVTRDETLTRPREGDLLYVPFIKAAFRIRYVDKKAFFYQLGELQAWDVVAELYEASSEAFDTGVPIIDDTYRSVTESLEDTVLNTEAGELVKCEDGWYLEWVVGEEIVPDMDDSLEIERVADDFVDWTEQNPFGDEGVNT